MRFSAGFHRKGNKMLLRVSVVSIALLLLGIADFAAAQDAEASYSRRGADTCLGCHSDWDPPLMGIFQTPHGNPHDARAPFGEGQLQCEACHGPGGAHTGRVKRGDPRPPIYNFGSGLDAGPGAERRVPDCHAGHVGEQWAGSAHDINTVACADCHTLHTPSDPMLDKRTQPDACYACHANVKSDFLKPSAHPVRQGALGLHRLPQPARDGERSLLLAHRRSTRPATAATRRSAAR
jgi:predicted CXXCH cytochrome family protein